MALTSSSHASSYHVFLSFRGSDTRLGFTGNLYNALTNKGFYTFIDNEKLQSGEEIRPSLVKAIKESRIAIILLSKDYASSSFCLDELATIIDCKTKGMLVIPVFYEVDPSDVRHQRGSYGEALTKHEERFQHNPDKLQKWKMALCQVADLSGYHFKKGDEHEYKFIDRIVASVSEKINHPARLRVGDYLVGLDSRVAEVMKLSDVESDDGVHIIGIHGMGGVGKSTLARAVYNDYLIAGKFDGSCYLENVREESNRHGLKHLQSILLQELLGDKNINLASVSKGASMIEDRLRLKKVLLVLDDVDKDEQLKAIVGSPDWFGSGSRVIITTRDEQLLKSREVKRRYEVKELDDEDALQLLTWNAFKKDKADPTYEEVLNRVVTYASGLPLALEVIGSHLFGKSIEEWEAAIDQYKRIPHDRIQAILKVSFDALQDEEKSVFLDIACCLKGLKLTEVEDILRAHCGGRNLKHHIGVLVEKSLIKFKVWWLQRVTMHDLIEDMGKEIVRQESLKEPGKRSRLWSPQDVINVLEDNTGTNEIEMICVDFSILEEEVEWDGNAFKNMSNLKTLIVRHGIFSEGPKLLPKNLRVLEWWGYPSNSLPDNCQPKELAICKLPHSRLMSLELGGSLKKFKNLTVLNFDKCKQLTRICNISSCPNLEGLSFKWCTNLETVHESNGSLVLHKLKVLSAYGCSKLQSFPPINLPSLGILELSDCSSLESFPEILGKMENIKILFLFKTAIKELPMSFQHLIGLEELSMRGLPSSFVVMPQLPQSEAIGFKGFSKLRSLSAAGNYLNDDFFSIGFTRFKHVTFLDLSKNDFTVLPECFKEFQSLSRLVVNECLYLQEIKGVPPNIKTFLAEYVHSLTSSSTSMLINKDQYWAGACVLPKACVLEVFNHQSWRPLNSFWFRNKSPEKVLCLQIKPPTRERNCSTPMVVINGKVHETLSDEFKKREVNMPPRHASVFNLEWWNYDQFEVPLENEWIHVEVTYAGGIDTSTDAETRIHLLISMQESNNEDIQLTDPYAMRNIFHFGLNYAAWSEMIKFQLSAKHLDLALVMDESLPTDNPLYEAWEQSNRSALDLMRSTIAANVTSVMPKTDNAKEFMKLIKNYYNRVMPKTDNTKEFMKLIKNYYNRNRNPQ